MTDKQKEAIEYFKKRIDICMENANICDDNDFDEEATYLRKEQILIETVLKLIQTQQAEIEHQKEKRENQKKELAILNEKQKEFNKLRNTVNSYKGQFKRQQAEIKKKDKESHFIQSELDIANAKIIELKRMIDLMANYICSKSFDDITNRLKDDNIAYWGVEESIKQYFERKSENGN